MTEIDLAALRSRTPLHPRRTARRGDPYELWRGRALGHWALAEGEHAPSWLRMRKDEARERVLAPHNRERILRVMAVLDQWRTATVEQVEALADVEGLSRGRTSLVSALWNAGLVDVGRWGHTWGQVPPREQLLLRPAGDSGAVQDLASVLGWADWFSVTAGLGFDASRQYARHNVLATEFGLRMAEHGQVGMVLGEKLSSWELLVRPVPGAPDLPRGGQSAADLTLIRPDGLRVLVEITATTSGMDAKVRRLAKLLHQRPVAWTGLTAVFVIVPRHDKPDSTRADLRVVTRAIERAVRSFPGMAGDPTAAKIGVVTWRALFPRNGTARQDFGTLPTMVATGPPSARWQTSRLLDPATFPFQPKDPESIQAVLRNTITLRGIPASLRPHGTELPTGGGKVKLRKRHDPSLARLMLMG